MNNALNYGEHCRRPASTRNISFITEFVQCSYKLDALLDPHLFDTSLLFKKMELRGVAHILLILSLIHI